MNTILSKLKKLNLREAWAHEAMDLPSVLKFKEAFGKLCKKYKAK